MISVSVIGSCVCRDLFEKEADFFPVKTDIRFVSPFSFVSDGVSEIKVSINDLEKKASIFNGNWYKKNLINDINKDFTQSLKEKHGDYLILDLAEARMPIASFELPLTKKRLVVTFSKSFAAHYDKNLKQGILKNSIMNIINPLAISDCEWEKTIDSFANMILSIFDEDKIILLQNMPASYYLKDEKLEPYSSSVHRNIINTCELLLPKLNEMFIKKCPKCHVIKTPNFILGDSKHKWGNYPFHFIESHYEYLLKSIKLVFENKEDELIQLYNEFSLLLEEKINSAKLCSINNYYQKRAFEINYLNVINDNEFLNSLSKKKKACLLFILNKREFFSFINNSFKKKKKK